MTFLRKQELTSCFKGLRVLVTGHTGFKGAWLSLMLSDLGAEVHGISLPPMEPSFFNSCKIHQLLKSSQFIDIRDLQTLMNAIQVIQPQLVIHFAAQSLVLTGLRDPISTFSTNVLGTAHVIESVRTCSSVRAMVIATSDKCYDPYASKCPFSECAPLGGYEPYSASKACAEMVAASYRSSKLINIPMATARAGNVIGGGDWAADRLIPDCVRALCQKQPIVIRNPKHIRPWQHVLEPLVGYMILAMDLLHLGVEFSGSWNFGPRSSNAISVLDLVKLTCARWPDESKFLVDQKVAQMETQRLEIDSSKAIEKLSWQPRWNVEEAVAFTMDWYIHAHQNQDLLSFSRGQIEAYFEE